MAYLIHTATLAAIYIMVALSYAIPVGYTGLLNLGHIGLVGIGAYASAIMTARGISFWLALPAAAAATAVVGFLLALPTRRIRGDYYALITLGFTFVVNAALLNGGVLTGGPFGISGIDRPVGFAEPLPFFGLSLVALSLVATFVFRLTHSPFGRALEAVRDDELAAESLGKPVAKLRLACLTVSAFLVGIAGALLAHFLRFINPQVFWLDNVLWILAGLVIGGLASFRGAIAGTLLLFAIFEGIRFLPISDTMLAQLIGPLRLILFSLLLILAVLFRPKGLFGRAQLE